MRRFGKRNSKLTPILISGLVILLITFGILIAHSSLFTIKKVELGFDKVSCANSNDLENTSGVLGQNLIFLDSSKVINTIKDKFICIRDVKVSKKLPDKVNLQVLGREAQGKLIILESFEATQSSLENIATPSAATFKGFLVDKDGVVFSESLEQVNTPSIFLKNTEISLGSKLENSISNSLKILERVKIFNLNFTSALISDNYLIVFPQVDNPKVIFRLDSAIETQLASLQLILEKAKIDERMMEFIDLRFDKPIVRFAPKQK